MPEAVADAPSIAIPEVVSTSPGPIAPPPAKPAAAADGPIKPRPAMDRVKAALHKAARDEAAPAVQRPSPAQEMRDRARKAQDEYNKSRQAPEASETKPEPGKEGEPKAGEEKPGEAKPGEVKPGETKPGEEAPKDEKTGPWALKTKYEKLWKAAEKEKAELSRRLTETGDAKGLQERAEKAEARLKEVEEQIRLTNYSQSQEFQEKYEKPYEEAWVRAVRDISELLVTDPEGNTRAADQNDLLLLARIPSKTEALQKAREMFGDDFYRDALDARKTVRDAAEQRDLAVQNANKSAQERAKQTSDIRREVAQTYQQSVAADAQKYEFLRPKEGDAEWNSALERSTNFVKQAYERNSYDPKLTPEERRELIRKHAAIQGRAVGFSMLRLENKRLRAELEKTRGELKKYGDNEPGPGSPKGDGPKPDKGQSAMERAKAALRARGRPDPY